MDSREEVVALRASLVQQAHDYRAQVVFWGDNADQRTAEVASLRARVAELEAQIGDYEEKMAPAPTRSTPAPTKPTSLSVSATTNTP